MVNVLQIRNQIHLKVKMTLCSLWKVIKKKLEELNVRQKRYKQAYLGIFESKHVQLEQHFYATHQRSSSEYVPSVGIKSWDKMTVV
jgi:hypothetical protein